MYCSNIWWRLRCLCSRLLQSSNFECPLRSELLPSSCNEFSIKREKYYFRSFTGPVRLLPYLIPISISLSRGPPTIYMGSWCLGFVYCYWFWVSANDDIGRPFYRFTYMYTLPGVKRERGSPFYVYAHFAGSKTWTWLITSWLFLARSSNQPIRFVDLTWRCSHE